MHEALPQWVLVAHRAMLLMLLLMLVLSPARQCHLYRR